MTCVEPLVHLADLPSGADLAVSVASDDIAACFVAFVVGCLGVVEAPKAGGKLGLMGNTSEEEFATVLLHLETLAQQRAAKIAGLPAPTAAGVCSERFLAALGNACTGSPQSVSELFARLPHDGSGRADLLGMFGMGGAIVSSSEFPSDYVESAVDLPVATDDAWNAAELQIGSPVQESHWEADAGAINTLRSRFLRQKEVAISAALISSIVARCGSRRPALARTALRALIELAEVEAPGSVWSEAGEPALAACLGSLRVSKVVARVAESALAAVARRVAIDVSVPVALLALTARTSACAKARPPQPPAVKAGLQALAVLCASSSWSTLEGALAAHAAVTTLCEDVLKIKTLGPTYAEARALLHCLPSILAVDSGAASPGAES